jgi:hypothetical protein
MLKGIVQDRLGDPVAGEDEEPRRLASFGDLDGDRALFRIPASQKAGNVYGWDRVSAECLSLHTESLERIGSSGYLR